MKPSIIKLRNYFKLEAKNEYQNSAVIGGLERMLEPWAAEARAENLPETIIQAVTTRLRDYHRLSEESRKETLYGLWNRIQRELGDGKPPQESAKPRAQPTPEKAPPPQESDQRTPSEVETPTPEPEPIPKLRPQLSPGEGADLNADVTTLKRVGPSYAKTLERLGIRTLGDMLYHFPHRYDDYSKMKPINRLGVGEKVSVIGTVTSVNTRDTRGGRTKLVEAVINDGSAAMRVTWFNQPWIKKQLRQGIQIVVSGQTDQYLGRLTMNNPDWTPIEKKNLMSEGIVPIYPLTAKITQRWMRNKMHAMVTDWAPKVHDPLPSALLHDAELMDLSRALREIHFPTTWEQLKEARHRLSFDEIFLLQLGVLQQKQDWFKRTASVFRQEEGWLDRQLQRLPFTLTSAQQRTLSEVMNDLASGHPMNRLIQGDVGSGKTIIAALAIALITDQGSQAAMMAPTSILAEQHYHSLLKLLTTNGGPLRPEQIHLMVGATSESEKIEIRAGLASGEISVVIGTHALIEAPVEFHDIQLAIVDEQHRFGVRQRAALRAKGTNPHLMVMTATPIPRSLALTVYGDLDLSLIDEMPPGRQDVETHVLYPKERERAYSLIRRQVEAGHQAFIIYPLVEKSGTQHASDESPEKAAVEEHAYLQKEVFPDLKLGLLHGRLPPADKEEVMTKFRERQIDILVSTSVVEVGVDIPNATVMLVEGAHRFGLAQLHQFRGRVGRGEAKAYCLLIPSQANAVENERLLAMVETNDGFDLAEKDLGQRGPGEFLGTRQSGYSELRLASLTDLKLIQKARHHAQALFQRDPDLSYAEHQQLADTLNRFWSSGSGDIS